LNPRRNIQFKDFDHGANFPLSFDNTYSRLIDINHRWLKNDLNWLELEITRKVSPDSGEAVYFFSVEWVEFIRIREISVFIISTSFEN
jgi:hypothetical protein